MGRGKRNKSQGTALLERPQPGPLRRSAKPDLLLGHDDELPGLSDPSALEAVTALSELGERVLGQRLARGLVVDLDDTLNVNHSLFLKSRGQLVEVYRQLDEGGRDDYQLGLEHRDISNALIPRYGFTPTRWREGSLDAGRHFASRELSEEERALILTAAEVGVGIGELYQGVEETLALLNEAKVPMVLLTKGELNKQTEKIAGHRLERFFDDILIVDQKDSALLRSLAAERGWQHPVIIGDSEKSDVVPAQEAGFDAVLVDRGAPKWIMESHHDPLEVPRAANFPAAVALLAGL